MNCEETLALLRDHCDGALPEGVSSAVRRHLMACRDCHRAERQELRLLAVLRSQPVVPPRPGFAHDALRRARRQGSGAFPASRSRWFVGGFAGGLASAVGAAAVWMLLVVAPGQPPGSAESAFGTVADDVQRVGVVIQSPSDLDAVTVSLVLPEGFELAGHPGKQHLSWTTRLTKGENMLSLPIIARAQHDDELFVNLRHGNDTRIFRVRLTAPRAPAAAAPGAVTG